MSDQYGRIRRWWMTKFFDVKFATSVSKEVREICSRYGEQVVALTFARPIAVPTLIGLEPILSDDLYSICTDQKKRFEIREWLAEQSSIKDYRERWTSLRDLLLETFVILLIGGELILGYVQERQQSKNFKDQQQILTNLNDSSKATADTLKALKETTDLELAEMKKTADQAEKSGKTAAQTLHLSQRSYLVAVISIDPPKTNEKLKVEATIHNSGKTVANDAVSLLNAIAISRGISESDAFKQTMKNDPSKVVSRTVLGDGQAMSVIFESPNGLTDGSTTNIENGNIIVYAFLRITYKDTFAHEHHTQSCVFYNPSEKRTNNCASMNSAD